MTSYYKHFERPSGRPTPCLSWKLTAWSLGNPSFSWSGGMNFVGMQISTTCPPPICTSNRSSLHWHGTRLFKAAQNSLHQLISWSWTLWTNFRHFRIISSSCQVSVNFNNESSHIPFIQGMIPLETNVPGWWLEKNLTRVANLIWFGKRSKKLSVLQPEEASFEECYPEDIFPSMPLLSSGTFSANLQIVP